VNDENGQGTSASRRDPPCKQRLAAFGSVRGHCIQPVSHHAGGQAACYAPGSVYNGENARSDRVPPFSSPHEPWCRSMTLEPVPPIPLHSSPGAGVASGPVSPPPAALEQHSALRFPLPSRFPDRERSTDFLPCSSRLWPSSWPPRPPATATCGCTWRRVGC